jgi:hypothetical protein
MLRSGRWLLAAAWLFASRALSSPSRGQAPPPRTDAELGAARQLFAEALRAEKEKRFDVALDGFRRVREVRDTAPVEYRIGTCLEGLGRLPEAISAYTAAVRLSEGDAAAADVGAGSRERIDALSKLVPPPPPAQAPPDSGPHPDEKPPPAPPAAAEGAPVATSPIATWGWVGIAAGGALVAASVTSLVLRESDIRTANRDCPGGGCIGSIDPDAQSATNRARFEGPLGLGLGVAGVVAAGLGAYLVVTTPSRAVALSVAPMVSRDGAGLSLRGAL